MDKCRATDLKTNDIVTDESVARREERDTTCVEQLATLMFPFEFAFI